MRRFLPLLLLAVLLVSSGCTSPRDAEVKRVITEYNDLLPAAYERPQPELLNNLASEAEVNRATMYVLYLQKRGEIIQNRLLGLDFAKVAFEGDAKATVETDEQWEYRMLDATTRTPKSEEFTRISYHSTYKLGKTGGKWLIVGLEVDEQGGAGGRPQ